MSVPAFGPVSIGTEGNGYLFLTCEADGMVVAENDYITIPPRSTKTIICMLPMEMESKWLVAIENS